MQHVCYWCLMFKKKIPIVVLKCKILCDKMSKCKNNFVAVCCSGK